MLAWREYNWAHASAAAKAAKIKTPMMMTSMVETVTDISLNFERCCLTGTRRALRWIKTAS